MNEYERITEQADALMANAVTGCQVLLDRDNTQGLLGEALVNALSALTLEVRGLRRTQEFLAELADKARVGNF